MWCVYLVAERRKPLSLILVVDDEPKIVKLARDYLERSGYTVLTVRRRTALLSGMRSSTISIRSIPRNS